MNRDKLKKIAGEKRFIPGIYNYCDRWCERCPQTSRCLNFAMVQEESSDPEAQDIRNEAFWKKLSGIFAETLELLKESAKEWGIDLETLDSANDTEKLRANDEAAESHVICRAARNYSRMVEEWFNGKERLFFDTGALSNEELNLEEAIEVIRWYQYFIAAKVMRAARGKIDEEEEERDDKFPSDSDGSAKIALIAIDRSIAAWAVIRHYVTDDAGGVIDIIAFLDGLGQAVEKTFPGARSFIRPGFDEPDPKG
jgi:hypothetical protein